jgi:hypothetical protein
MREKNNDIEYTAADIEQYHRGLLSPKEMFAMEKAALDDPFLADALEGYDCRGISINDDLVELKARLANRLQDAQPMPRIDAVSRPFPWLRAAAMMVAIAGAALLVYQFGIKEQSLRNIADVPAKQQPVVKEEESVSESPLHSQRMSDTTTADASSMSLAQPETKLFKPDTRTGANNDKAQMDYNRAKQDSATNLAVDNTKTQIPVVPEISAEPRKKELLDNGEIAGNIKRAGNDGENKAKEYSSVRSDSNLPVSEEQRNAVPSMVQSDIDKRRQAYTKLNQFRGQVRDASNHALPFANITNTNDNVGTYSDAKGNFVLTSPDTVLNVQVRSLGFENNNLQLRNNIPTNQVILQDDRKSLSEVVISNKKVNSNRARDQHMILEEPEPADGWDNYDIYLANNLHLPESLKPRETNGNTYGEVELSFEVNKYGDPVNIKVEKSLCDKCDKEAIRLVKQGPKWKPKAKKGRTSVKIAF